MLWHEHTRIIYYTIKLCILVQKCISKFLY